MALHDEILREMMASRVLWRFKTSHLKGIPANRAGYYIVGRGEYRRTRSTRYPATIVFARMELILDTTSGGAGSQHSSGMGMASTNLSSNTDTRSTMSVRTMRSSRGSRVTERPQSSLMFAVLTIFPCLSRSIEIECAKSQRKKLILLRSSFATLPRSHSKHITGANQSGP